ncbi:ComEC/Rec2 family competence protein [Pinibacter aurantiacus]|uniref:ComEC family competence protein n=1 Tax=Pinibacter aurantiacus TaxID=2851599 RepID=A0A9E2S7N9_9BACT|nr:ComEC/Rec2 family competence protein [Pinibacter aurantiacus]MBV4357741.1 ComEC family competence protein [Pinibacter aurantiacus]
MQYTIHLWKQAPFLRLLLPFIIGLLLQYHFAFVLNAWLAIAAIACLVFVVFLLLPLKRKFSQSWISGVAINATLICLGGILFYENTGTNDAWCIKNNYASQKLLLTLQEPLTEKERSFKAKATVELMGDDSTCKSATGNIIVYLQKDSLKPALTYGSQIVIDKPLQLIRNSGNPACFDYEQYCAFQHIYYQVFLKPSEYVVLKEKKTNFAKQFLFNANDAITTILQKNITGTKELGLAEALLIGYKEDLDKTLVQSYSNTGVVHIIAISGLHLGVIYFLLLLLLKPLSDKRKLNRILKPVIVIAFLWLFSIMSGASPSVLRSAVMFTCIVIGNSISKQSSVYNTLSVSALLLLCYNPFWLWDVGFQLSYAALLSIVIFMKPVYHCIYITNKLLDKIWQAAAVTLAAQVLTTPISIYYFHQFPVFFLMTNLLAVPISTIILIGEIVLCCVSFIAPVAAFVGKILTSLLWLMNTIVERIEAIPFNMWGGLQISILQNLVLYIFIASVALWLLEKYKHYMYVSLLSLLLFVSLRTYSFYKASKQERIIVYNIPQRQAIDIINGRNYQFIGDKELRQDGFLQSFHLKPSRILQRIKSDTANTENIILWKGKRIVILNESMGYEKTGEKINADVIIISHSPMLNICDITNVFDFKTIVFDGSNADWKISKWKEECKQLNQQYFSVKDGGAFIMDF